MTADQMALLAAGFFLLAGMITGVWKYWHMARSEEAQAPVYVDICHRTCLMYGFACVILQQLAENSRWNAETNTLAVLVPILFFAAAVTSYAIHGVLRDTDNQMRRPHVLGRLRLPSWCMVLFMLALILAEIGGTSVLVLGNL